MHTLVPRNVLLPYALVLLAFNLVLCHDAAAQGASVPDSGKAHLLRSYTDSLNASASDSLLLRGQFIDTASVSLRTGGGNIIPPDEYSLDARAGRLKLLPAFYLRRDSTQILIVYISYRALPFSFAPEYRKRTLVSRIDTASGDTLQVSTPAAPLNLESIFGSDLQKSGYIGRGFTVGSNRDLSLNSGFRLQLSGPLSDDISLVAALTDENTPIQPEGNTKTLQELDKVFIKIFNPNFAITLGDFNIAYGGTEFGKYNRKLAGAMGEARSEDAEGSFSYATMKGTFRSMQFNGDDGVQGPYRLTGKNGEQRILVLAGTEKVYVDGILMERGETNDYVIEYANGEVFFQPRRLITSYSRITVDFEYADREYVRSMIAGGGSGEAFTDKVRVTARYIRESDDPDSPIDQEFSENDRAVLESAGDDTQAASTSGAVFVGTDTARGNGAGTYIRIDTLVAGEPYALYRYQPGADSATYNVTFSYVGAGLGDYKRESLGAYNFVGRNAGDYAPIRLLPLPRMHQLADFALTVTPINKTTIDAEIGVSDLDANRFSLVDDADNTGAAYQFRLTSRLDSTAAGAFDMAASFRSQGSTFRPIDRIDDIEFNRKWDLSATAPATETIREGRIGYEPHKQIRITGGAGSYTKGPFSSLRTEGGFRLAQDSLIAWLPATDYIAEYIASDNRGSLTRSAWFRHRGDMRYRAPVVTPFVTFEQEHKEMFAGASDSLAPGSLAFFDVRPGVEFPALGVLRASVNTGYRVDDAWLDGALTQQSKDLIQQLTIALHKWNDLSGSASFTLRNRTYTDAFAQQGNNDLETILTKVQIQYSPWKSALITDLLYDVSTERTSRLERVFLPVPYGQGNYIYKGDLNNNGVQDENEFEPTRFEGDFILLTVPTDELFPVIDLRTSARVRFEPGKLLTVPASTNFTTEMADAVSTESYVRVDEKSEDANTSNIYLLKTSSFLNDSTTVQGFQNMRQDLFLFERKQDFSLRFRFDQNRGFNKYALSTERSYKREQSVRLRTQPMREIGIQSDFALITDNVGTSDENSNRRRTITATSFKTDLSYRPERNVEVGFVIDTRSATDAHYTTPLDASINSQTLRTTVSFPGPGRLRVEFERSEVLFSSAVDVFPFELTDGKPEGKSWVWRLNFDYRITSYLQANIYYLGRAETARTAVHTARAEVKAFF